MHPFFTVSWHYALRERHRAATWICTTLAIATLTIGLPSCSSPVSATVATISDIAEGRINDSVVAVRLRAIDPGIAITPTNFVVARAVDEANDTVVVAARCSPAATTEFTTVRGRAYTAHLIGGLLRIGPVIVIDTARSR